MANSSRKLNPIALALAGMGFVLGIGIGIGLAWQVWPVRWYNTDPSDLRVAHQIQHVLMTSDSLALTGDVEVARQRIEGLVDDDTNVTQVANLVERVAVARENSGDAAAALRVRRLAEALKLPDPTLSEFHTPGRRLALVPSWLGYILLALGACVLFAALLIWLRMRPKKAGVIKEARVPAARPSPPADAYEYLRADQGAAPETPTERPPAKARPEPREEEQRRSYSAQEQAQPLEPEPQEIPYTPDADRLTFSEPPEETIEEESAPPRAEAEPEPVQPPPAAQPEILAPSSAAVQSQNVLSIFEAEYAYGDDDFDCSFSIEAEDGNFLGECGVGIGGVLGINDAQQVDAFEVWLFDKGDIRTVTRILASEHADRDASRSAQLEAKAETVVAQRGLVIELETLSLRVSAVVKGFEYVEDREHPNAYFSHLELEMVVERSADLI